MALAAAALGATVIEKHFTLDRGLAGPDHRASLEPHELAAMVRGIRIVESALGDGRKVPAKGEIENRKIVRKSLVAARDLASGTVLELDDLVIKRPGTGLPPAARRDIVGRRAARRIPVGTVLTRDMIG